VFLTTIIILENSSSPVDMHTHTGNAYDNQKTFTFWHWGQCMLSNGHALSMFTKFGADSSSTFPITATVNHTLATAGMSSNYDTQK